MKIRPVVAADTEAVVALWRRVFPEYADPDRPQRDPRTNVVRKLAVTDGLFWCVVEGDQICATAMAGWDSHRGWLYSVGVDPLWRGLGFAQALVKHAERELAARGCPKINLQVLGANETGLAFWRALGYQTDAVVSLGKRL